MHENKILRYLAAIVLRAGGEITLSNGDLDRPDDLEVDIVDTDGGATGIRFRASGR